LKIAEMSVSQNFTLKLNCHNITDDYNLQRGTVKLKKDRQHVAKVTYSA